MIYSLEYGQVNDTYLFQSTIIYIFIGWNLFMPGESKQKGGECVYGKAVFAVCTNPNCRKPGLICENGFYNKE